MIEPADIRATPLPYFGNGTPYHVPVGFALAAGF
jgi:hypothetical protein